MAKKKERSVNVSGKPKHSLDVNRDQSKGKSNNGRSAATVRRLKMYNTRPIRNSGGKILKHDLQSKELPSTRIMPDRRWFGAFFYGLTLFTSSLFDQAFDYLLLGNGLLQYAFAPVFEFSVALTH